MSDIPFVCPYTNEKLTFDGEKYRSESGREFFVKKPKVKTKKRLCYCSENNRL